MNRPRAHVALVFLILLFGGCASGPQNASGGVIKPEAIQLAHQLVAQRQIPPEIRTEFFSLYAEGRQNSVLHAMRAGLAALRIQRRDLAKEVWDQAIREVEEMQYGQAQAERAKSKFVGEREKWFKGEPYERSALYLYRGLLYLEDQDFGNAAACFKRAQVMDITADDASDFSGDWISAEAALILASYRQNDLQTVEQSLQRIRSYHEFKGSFSLPTATTNAVLIVEMGRGPIKWGDGKFGELLRFKEAPLSVQKMKLSSLSEEQEVVREKIYFQASTRGGRLIDAVLDDKASFKEDTQNATLGLAGGAVVASQAEQSGIAAGVLGLAAVGTGIFSAVTSPQADLRSWENLPHSLYLLFLTVPPEGVKGEWRALDAEGKEIIKKSFEVPFSNSSKIQVIWDRVLP